MLRRIIVFSLMLILPCAMLMTGVASSESKAKSQEPLTVTVVPVGPDQAKIEATKTRLKNNASVRAHLRGTKIRILSFELLDTEVKMPGRAAPPDRFRAVLFAYDTNQAVQVEAPFDSDKLGITVLAKQSDVFSAEEFDEAVTILSRDPYFGPLLRDNILKPYRPMPPISYAEQSQDKFERTVNVGLSSRDGGQIPEIVGVNMVREKVLRFKTGAPKTAIASPSACGLPGSGQGSTGRGQAGQYEMTISQGPTVLWQMTIIRPSASSGTRASAVELRNVDYRGKRVFARAHVPVLNVLYVNNACGPYRDWQYQEGFFAATGTDIPNTNNSFRLCSAAPQTILDNSTDTGNFRGVAVYTNGDETTIISEMEAGWYRYISEWHFFADGRIQPRFGFGGVTNSCVCNDHNHHVYWRFDFDVAGASPNSVYGPGLRSWPYPIATEVKLIRSLFDDNRLNVQNLATGDTYSITPGFKDGSAFNDAYARGDAWVLVRDPNGGELDDGYNSTGGSGTAINLDPFTNGQSVQGKDIVVWYGAHFLHTVDDQLSHRVGPDLAALSW
jgi:hypothetical protein